MWHKWLKSGCSSTLGRVDYIYPLNSVRQPLEQSVLSTRVFEFLLNLLSKLLIEEDELDTLTPLSQSPGSVLIET